MSRGRIWIECSTLNILFFSAAPRLDYQPLFGRGARAPPRSHGCTREDFFVSLSQSDNRPQIFVGHESVHKLSRQNIVNKMADDVELMALARARILGRLGVISTEVSSSYLSERFSDGLVTRHLQNSKRKPANFYITKAFLIFHMGLIFKSKWFSLQDITLNRDTNPLYGIQGKSRHF